MTVNGGLQTARVGGRRTVDDRRRTSDPRHRRVGQRGAGRGESARGVGAELVTLSGPGRWEHREPLPLVGVPAAVGADTDAVERGGRVRGGEPDLLPTGWVGWGSF